MNKTELIARLQYYNEWRRGADTQMPDPAQLGWDIDAAVEILKEVKIEKGQGMKGLTKQKPRRSKYNNRKTVVDGLTFDSAKEAKRYGELKLLERAGEIINLELQPEYELIPRQKGHRATKYRADFKYTTKGGSVVVEDVKSPATKTQAYRIKKKLMAWNHGIDVVEV